MSRFPFRALHRCWAGVLLLAALMAAPAAAEAPEDWNAVVERARGQTVFWHAWAGDERINAYLAWVGETVAARYGITLRHVRINDAAEAVVLVQAGKAAGRTEGGRVDLVWINGDNFKAMRDNGLLFGPLAGRLPNLARVDTENKPAIKVDLAVPTEGLEVPWGMTQLVFYHDGARLPDPPRTLSGLRDWLQAHPGRFTYPAPPDAVGLAFLKQALIDRVTHPAVLERPVTSAALFHATTESLWSWLDGLHPLLWQGGEPWQGQEPAGAVFPPNYPILRRLVATGELDIGFSFTPTEASAAIAQGLLPETVCSFALDGGTVATGHFVAIPFNANARDGAMVVANFLLSPEAQARKADPQGWGDATVLALDRLPPEDRKWFEQLARGPADLPPDGLGRALPEPHPSWMAQLQTEWLRRYGR